MHRSSLPLRNQRTLVLGLGEGGSAVVRACHRRLQQRWDSPDHVAFLAVQGASGTSEPVYAHVDLVPTLTVPIGHEDLTRREAHGTLHAAAPALISALVEQLVAITRIPTLNQRSLSSDQVNVFLVAALDDPWGGAALVDVAYLVRYLVRQRLNTASQVTGLCLLPDPLHLENPVPAMARAYATLRELEATLQPHDGHQVAWSESLTVDSWGPSMDQGCYLIAGLNANGLGLSVAGDRVEAAGEMLLHLAVAPLGAHCISPTLSNWGTARHSSAYASAGVAAWVYPVSPLSDVLANRIARDLLCAWLKSDAVLSSAPDLRSETRVFLAQAGLGRTDVVDALVPAAELEAAGLWQPPSVPLSWSNVTRYRQALDDGLATRLEPLAGRRQELDDRARQVGRAVKPALLAHVNGILDGHTPGSLPMGRGYLAALHEGLTTLICEAQALADQSWQEMERLDAKIQAVGQSIDSLSSLFPKPAGRQLVKLFLNPGRVWRLLQAWQKLQELSAAYQALQLGYMEQGIALLRNDLLVETYQEATEAVHAQQHRIDRLIIAVQAAEQRLAAALTPAIYGALGFSLETSVLTEETVETLYQDTRGNLAGLLADVAKSDDPLSGWPGADADGEDVAGVYLDFARARCAGLADTSFDTLLLAMTGEESRQRLEALHALTKAASPFLAYDDARLDQAGAAIVYSCAVLGFPAPAPGGLDANGRATVLDGLDDLLFAQVAAGGEPHRLTALTAVFGISLSALPLLDEFAEAYRKLDPAGLHVTDNWEALPDPMSSVPEPDEPGDIRIKSDWSDNEEVVDYEPVSL